MVNFAHILGCLGVEIQLSLFKRATLSAMLRHFDEIWSVVYVWETMHLLKDHPLSIIHWKETFKAFCEPYAC